MIRVPTGVEGLDRLLGGGVPRGHTIALIGPPGTGKTTFALQFAATGLLHDEKCIYISLEEDEETLLSTATGYGWDLKNHRDRGTLQMLKLDPADIDTALTKLESELPGLIKSFGASRLVIDPYTMLEMLQEDVLMRRRRTFQLCNLAQEDGATVLLTSEVSPDNPFASRFGMLEYVADGVILLHRVMSEDQSKTQLAIEVVKMRRTTHSKEVKPYTISEKGIQVYSDLRISLRGLTRY
ncbi:MAG: KaiC domain-containing protein [Euryarchaeota archaeon]|nr:KaiC domain-containing protein [Euryarchaeota archaeon]